jgi:hypothetical protein
VGSHAATFAAEKDVNTSVNVENDSGYSAGRINPVPETTATDFGCLPAVNAE